MYDSRDSDLLSVGDRWVEPYRIAVTSRIEGLEELMELENFGP